MGFIPVKDVYENYTFNSSLVLASRWCTENSGFYLSPGNSWRIPYEIQSESG